MFKPSLWLAGLLAWLPMSAAFGDVLVLVHGYASDAGVWEASGVNQELRVHGWLPVGVLSPVHPASGPYLPVGINNRSFVASLPATAPLLIQASYLRAFLDSLRQQYPVDELTLVGHSAGGVVARLALLGGNPYRVNRLISIAAPNLGTERAIQGLDVVDSKPFFCPGPGIDFIKSAFGGGGYNYLKYSRGVLFDLLPAEPGTLLFWANQQPYPDIEYIAIVRRTPFMLGDWLVPVFSQDMNNVPALHGRVKTLFTESGHGLNPNDGRLLASLLAD